MSLGQLFPAISNFNGDIEKVVEKRYGKEVHLLNRWTGIYLPGCYSGWKYVYHLDTNGRLERRTNSFKGKLRADYIYKYDSRINAFPEEVFLHEFLHSLERNAQEYGYDRPEYSRSS